MRHYHVEEEIAAAISLYLDVINLFLAILVSSASDAPALYMLTPLKRILNSQQNN